MRHGIEPTNPFDPAHFAAVRKPLLEVGAMPPWVYTSEAFYKREVERIFLNSETPNIGSISIVKYSIDLLTLFSIIIISCP